MGKSNFDSLMNRYLRDQVTEEEKVKIEAWLDVMKTEGGEDLELSKEDEEKLYQNILKGLPGKQVRRWRRSLSVQSVLVMAAAILLVALSFLFWDRLSPATSPEKLILADGSLVWLKDGGDLIYVENNSDGTRRAQLRGAALFEVTKDSTRPFILECGDYTVTVLGTSFSVVPSTDAIEVEVLTGSVRVSSKNDSAGVVVQSNQRILYTGDKNVSSSPLTQQEVSTITLGTEYDMKFNNETMKTIVERIEKKFNVTVDVANRDIEECKITADFTDRSLSNTLLLVSDVLAIEYKIDGNQVTISGKGCGPR